MKPSHNSHLQDCDFDSDDDDGALVSQSKCISIMLAHYNTLLLYRYKLNWGYQ